MIRDCVANIEIHVIDNLQDAIVWVSQTDIDVFFVDVALSTTEPEDLSGIQFVEYLRDINKYLFTPVIFITSLQDKLSYAYEKLHCYGCIEKPFHLKPVKKLLLQCLKFPRISEQNHTLLYRKGGIVLTLQTEDIVYAQSRDHVLCLHRRKGDILQLSYITLKQFLKDVEHFGFIQCNRSMVVNKRYIESVDFVNRYILLKDDYGRVDIGSTYKNAVKEGLKTGR